MYTEATQASVELSRRRKDKGLQKAVVEYLGALPEGWPQDRPIATINRYVATARVEDIVFARAALSIGMRPFWPTYLAERYTATNPEKVSCLRPRIQRPKLQITRNWIVDNPQQLEGQQLGQIRVGDNGLQDVHDQARKLVLPDEIAGNTFDISSWNQSQAIRFGGSMENGRLAPFYYMGVMALYLCNGVLFEDFDGGPNAGSGLGEFVDTVVTPAIKSVTAEFGIEPLIVRLPYCPGFLDYPGECASVFDQARSAAQV